MVVTCTLAPVVATMLQSLAKASCGISEAPRLCCPMVFTASTSIGDGDGDDGAARGKGDVTVSMRTEHD